MSSKVSFKVDNLDKWEKWARDLPGEGITEFKSNFLRSAGYRGQEYAQDLTPRKSSRLAGSMSVGVKDNYFELKIGSANYVVYGTNVEYAEYIENGFSQENRKGQFVPGVWRGDTFYYDKNAKTGMVLTGAVIEGAHMYQKSLDYLLKDMDKLAEFELKRLYAKLKD